MLFPHEPTGPLGLVFAILGGLSWLAVVAGIVLLVIWGIRALSGSTLMRTASVAVETPLDTLARRFARGEITAEEYERSRDLLRGEGPRA